MITPAMVAERFAKPSVSRRMNTARPVQAGPAHRTLLVDHSPDSEFLLTDTQHFDVVGRTRSGREALTLVKRLQPDVVMLAFTIPDMNVIEVIRRLKSQPHAPRIVVLSNYEEPHHQNAVMKAGADAFVVKTELGSRILGRIARLCTERITRPATGFGNGKEKLSWLYASAAAAVIVVALACVVGAAFTSWHYWQEEHRARQREVDQQRQMFLKYWEGQTGKSLASEPSSVQ